METQEKSSDQKTVSTDHHTEFNVNSKEFIPKKAHHSKEEAHLNPSSKEFVPTEPHPVIEDENVTNLKNIVFVTW